MYVLCLVPALRHTVTWTLYGPEDVRLGGRVGKTGQANMSLGWRIVWALRFTSGLSNPPLEVCIQRAK